MTALEDDEVWQARPTSTVEDDEVSEMSALTLGEPVGIWRTVNVRWLRVRFLLFDSIVFYHNKRAVFLQVLHGRVIRLVSLFRRNAIFLKKDHPQL